MFGRALALSLALLAPAVAVAADPAAPSPIRGDLLVLRGGWSATLPPSGNVEAPVFVETLAPGQRIMLALAADGPEGRRMLGDCRLSVRIRAGDSTTALESLRPVAVRSVLAEGAGMISDLLENAGVRPEGTAGDSLQDALANVSLAVFAIDWVAPASARETEVHIDATVAGPRAAPAECHATLRLRPWADWQRDPVPTADELSPLIAGFHANPQPGRLLTLLTAVMRADAWRQPNMLGFFVAAFREYPAAKQAVLDAMPGLDGDVRAVLIMVLHLSGDDVTALAAGLPRESRAALDQAAPMSDPRVFVAPVDPVDPQVVAGFGNQADLCWGGWMATEDPSYLRALVGHLAGARDYRALKAWIKARTGAAGLNAAVARGLAYRVVGSSLVAFRTTDPQVRQWLSFWKTDPSMPDVVRQQLEKLATNPDF